MALPEQEQFTVKDVAARWEKPESYIQELIRTRQFPYMIIEDKSKDEPSTIHHLYLNRRYWPYGADIYISLGDNEVATLSDVDGEKDWLSDLIKCQSKEWRSPGDGASVYIPQTSLQAFEQEHDVDTPVEPSPPTNGNFTWIHSQWLRAAVEAYYEVYVLKNFSPKQAHKSQIVESLTKHYPKLTTNAKKIIAMVVNPNKKGGSPSLE